MSEDPAVGEPVATLATSTEADVDAAVERAHEAVRGSRWTSDGPTCSSSASPAFRARLLEEARRGLVWVNSYHHFYNEVASSGYKPSDIGVTLGTGGPARVHPGLAPQLRPDAEPVVEGGTATREGGHR